jgi:hypothetical protein
MDVNFTYYSKILLIHRCQGIQKIISTLYLILGYLKMRVGCTDVLMYNRCIWGGKWKTTSPHNVQKYMKVITTLPSQWKFVSLGFLTQDWIHLCTVQSSAVNSLFGIEISHMISKRKWSKNFLCT